MCKFWFHPDCVGLTQEEYQQALKWKEKREVDIWACPPCESSNEALDNKIKEINSKVDEVKKDVKEIADRQDKAELRDQVMDTRVSKQDNELQVLKERLAHLEADSGKHLLREMDDRKLREANVVIHKIPECDSDSAKDRRESDEATVQYLIDTIGLKIDVSQEVKFARRRGKLPEQSEREATEPRPLLVGFRCQQIQEKVLACSWKLSKVRDKATSEVRIVRDLTDRERRRERDLDIEVKNKNLNRTVRKPKKTWFSSQ